MKTVPILTLPGDIPGLLQRCSPVIDTTRPDARGVIFGLPGYDKGRPSMWGVNWMFVIHQTDRPPDLDLFDATGRAHAAWWLDGHNMPYDSAFDDTNWSRCAWHEYTDDWPFLADLDPNDPRLLPDGSRWVDAEALRRVVLHVAGRAI